VRNWTSDQVKVQVQKC